MSMRSPSGFIRPGFDPLKNPDAPTIGTATGGGEELSVTFTAPDEEGGSAITSYLATARKTSDGTLTSVSGASSPIVVTGLTNGDAYTATVLAINSYGPSAASEASNSATPISPPTVIGQAFGGGFYAGQISTTANGVATHYLVVGPKASAESILAWKNTRTDAPGANSTIDGPQITANMVADGSSTVYPSAHFCNNLTIGGFSDWYMPAYLELEVCYYNLRPSTQYANNTGGGANSYAVPSRSSNYEAYGAPFQTSAVDFQVGGAEAFNATGGSAYYWSSTQSNPYNGSMVSFSNGVQPVPLEKEFEYPVRAIRRVPV